MFSSPRSLVHNLLGLLVLFSSQVQALNNGLALTPPMGWLSWERFTCTTDCKIYPDDCINSKLYMSMADKLVADGYAELGYEYVNIDDCWSEKSRDVNSGRLVEDKARFPEGMQALSRYMHNKRLKLGIYGDCGTATCAGYPAQLKTETNLSDNYFELDAKLFDEWEIDSFKFDGCNLDPAKAESVCPNMSVSLMQPRRPITLICEWPFYMLMYNSNGTKLVPNFDLASENCNAWRYYNDVEDSWLSVLNIIDFSIELQKTIVKYHGPGHWFDPDQLVIGNFGLSLDQARAQMAIWSIWSAPLYMSNDLRSIDPEMRAVLKNKNLIAVDQDQLGVFGLMVEQSSDGRHQAFAKPVEPIRGGCPSFVIVYLNRDTLGNSNYISNPLRRLLTGLPIELAAERYNELYSRSDEQSTASSSSAAPPLPARRQRPGGDFVPGNCKRLLEHAMSEQHNKHLIRPMGQVVEQVHFKMVDLFGDPLESDEISLNGDLSLLVNPSGVRAVKLTLVN